MVVNLPKHVCENAAPSAPIVFCSDRVSLALATRLAGEQSTGFLLVVEGSSPLGVYCPADLEHAFGNRYWERLGSLPVGLFVTGIDRACELHPLFAAVFCELVLGELALVFFQAHPGARVGILHDGSGDWLTRLAMIARRLRA